jgi:hypothetical protein
MAKLKLSKLFIVKKKKINQKIKKNKKNKK